MDLGATICRRNKPLCVACPMQNSCQALAQDKVSALPTRKPKKDLPEKQVWMLLLTDHQQNVQLYQRPHKGIWGGLWSLPEFASLEDLENHLALMGTINSQPLPEVKHAFSHYKLTLHPYRVSLPANHGYIQESTRLKWYASQQIDTIGLPSPIKQILQQYWA
jgi:A/G-specific adenine glycosylase